MLIGIAGHGENGLELSQGVQPLRHPGARELAPELEPHGQEIGPEKKVGDRDEELVAAGIQKRHETLQTMDLRRGRAPLRQQALLKTRDQG